MLLSGTPAQALDPGLAALAEKGGACLYDLEFDRGTATFEQLAREYPGHPAGPMLVAATHWWKARYWFAKPDKAGEKVLDARLTEAVRLARAMHDRLETRCEADFFLGGALGARAHWELLKGNWMKAALGARESVSVLYATLSCSEYADEARFGLGIYEYAAASLPWSLRWLSRFVVGGSPTKEEGLAKLAAAAERSRFMRNDAQSTLVIILSLHRNDPAGAMKYAGMLARERPRSPVARSLLAQALFFSGQYDRVLDETGASLDRAGEPGSTFATEIPAFCYFRGMTLAMKGNLPDAVSAFDRAVATKGRAAWITASRLKRGCLFDLMGRRSEAVADYQAVLKSPDPWRLGKLARKHLAKPCTAEEFRAEASPHGGY
jgi:tetratricopeptide (TPR) repeat protein